MILHSWFKHKPLWLQGGIIGVAICLALAIFYATIYDYILTFSFPKGMLPVSSLILPMVTGHFFVLMSHFVAEGYVAPIFGCVADNAGCFERVESITLVVFSVLLLLVYFTIGSFIGWYVQKKNILTKK